MRLPPPEEDQRGLDLAGVVLEVMRSRRTWEGLGMESSGMQGEAWNDHAGSQVPGSTARWKLLSSPGKPARG